MGETSGKVAFSYLKYLLIELKNFVFMMNPL
jgi:hypothetical protein